MGTLCRNLVESWLYFHEPRHAQVFAAYSQLRDGVCINPIRAKWIALLSGHGKRIINCCHGVPWTTVTRRLTRSDMGGWMPSHNESRGPLVWHQSSPLGMKSSARKTQGRWSDFGDITVFCDKHECVVRDCWERTLTFEFMSYSWRTTNTKDGSPVQIPQRNFYRRMKLLLRL